MSRLIGKCSEKSKNLSKQEEEEKKNTEECKEV